MLKTSHTSIKLFTYPFVLRFNKMPKCGNCNKSQSRLVNGLCINRNSNQMNTATYPISFRYPNVSVENQPPFTDNTINQQPVSNDMNEYYLSNRLSTQTPQSTEVYGNSSTVSNITHPISTGTTPTNIPSTNRTAVLDRNKAPTIGDMIDFLRPLENRIASLETKMDQRVGTLENKVNILESGLQNEMKKNKVLADTIIAIQKSLNQIDNVNRANNLIISGLPEENIEIDDENTLEDDKNKLNYLLNSIGLGDITRDNADNFVIERIGKRGERNTTRLVKVNIGDSELRNMIKEESKKLKLLRSPWKAVCIRYT